MKAIRLTVKNIGMVADAIIELNKPLILFYGEIQQGKTTLLNAVKWVFGGPFPSDIIRNGESEALVRLDLDCGSISREWYRGRDGSTKARSLAFERDGVQVINPVAEIKKFLNPFLLDQDYLRNMTELERKKYFAATFAVDTRGLDAQIALGEAEAALAREKLKGYGDIDVTPVDPPADLQELLKVRESILAEHQNNLNVVSNKLAAWRKDDAVLRQDVARANNARQVANNEISLAEHEASALVLEIASLEAMVREKNSLLAVKKDWLASHARQDLLPIPPEPDMSVLEGALTLTANTAAVDAALRLVEANKVRFEQYQANLRRQAEREKVEATIVSASATVRELRTTKIAKLKSVSESTGIVGLEFDEAGNFKFEGSEAGMLSTSQLMRLSSMLSAMYPPGFGVDLIDRAESLGKSVFEFVERAKQENKTILAAVVGERPAEVPAEVGVFVVEQGVVK